jgi:hypothetical protein
MLRNINSIQSDLNSIIIQDKNSDKTIYLNSIPTSTPNPKGGYRELFRKHQGSIIRLFGKVFYYFLHLFLISLFETLFYFYYISKQEDEAIVSNLLTLTNSISYKCNLLPIEYRNEIIEILQNINNTEYFRAYDLRKMENDELFNYSMNYVYSFLIIIGVLGVLLGYYHNNRLKWKIMIMDTFIMIFILGIFEYNFFINIVKRYTPITKEELEYNIEKQIIINCG